MRLAPLLILYLVVATVAQPGPDPVRDEPALLAAAERLVEHGRLAGVGPDPDQRAYLWHGPGLVVVLAPFVALDAPLWLVRLMSPLLLFAAIVLFHRLLLVHLAPRRALAGAYALGLYPPFVIVLGTIQKEPLAVLLVVAAMLGAVTPTRASAAGAGLALAALAMVRPEYGWIILAFLAVAMVRWALRRGGARRQVVVAAIAAIACVPWLAYTYASTGQPLYWSTSAGLSLFWMSPTLPGQTGQWHSPVRVFRDPELAPYRPLFRRLDEVHPLESDRVLRRRALDQIRERPLVYARNVAANVARLFVFAPTRPSQPPAALALYGVGNGVLLGAVLWAAPGLWRRRRALPGATPAFALFAVLAVVVHLPPSASPRMLIPVVPVLVWLVAIRAGQRRPVTTTRPAPAPSTAAASGRSSAASPSISGPPSASPSSSRARSSACSRRWPTASP